MLVMVVFLLDTPLILKILSLVGILNKLTFKNSQQRSLQQSKKHLK
jgi:hypothetical protein